MINTTNIKNNNIAATNDIINKVNRDITGRVCKTDYLHNLLYLKQNNDIRTYVETGVYFGGSICLMLQDDKPCHHIGIDIFDGYYGDNKPDLFSSDICSIDITRKNIDNNNPHKHKVDLIKGSSYSQDTIKKVKKLISEIDLLLIDGDHTSKGVYGDYLGYKDLISSGGIIVFDNYGEKNVWTEVKEVVDSIDFSKDGFKPVGQYGWSYIVRRKTFNH